jgi:hypothetical protein
MRAAPHGDIEAVGDRERYRCCDLDRGRAPRDQRRMTGIALRARLLIAGIIGSMVWFARAPAWCGAFLLAVSCSVVPYWVRAGKLTAESRGRMMLTRSTKPSAKWLLVLVGGGLALLVVGVVVVVAVTRKNHHEGWPGQGTKWEGTLASTVFAVDAETGRLRWQTYLPGGPQLIAMRMSRAGVITLEAIILSGPCTGRPVSLDLDAGTGREVGRRNQLSFTNRIPAPPHGPVVADDGNSAYRVEAGPAGPVVRAVNAAGATRWQRAFPDPGDHFMSLPNVVTGVVDHGGGLFVAGSADYLGPRRCGAG